MGSLTAEASSVVATGLFQETEANDYQRVQRVRARRATTFTERETTKSNLITAATFALPIEEVLPES